jgi:thiamine-monophosphate kinase
VGEFELIARIAPFLAGAGGQVLVGHGDDATVIAVGGRGVCVTVDVLVEGVHFRRDLSSWTDIGWKAVAVNVSDLAAMGATPIGAVVGLCRPAALAQADVEAFYAGMRQACDRWGLRLLGGDTVRGPVFVVSVTALGDAEPERVVTRAGGRQGDRLVIVGALGAAAAALSQVEAGQPSHPALLAVHRRPMALPAAGRVLAAHGARAMIDVSDGLGADLGHLCAASGVGARLSAVTLPIMPSVVEVVGEDLWEVICGGGEDFALVAALPPEAAEAAAHAASVAEGVPSAVIGELVALDEGLPAVMLELPDGGRLVLDHMGYDHFAEGPTP